MEFGPFARESQPWPENQHDLSRCPDGCEGNFMQPMQWEQAGGRGLWRLWLRCGECNSRWDGIFGEADIDAYDEVLDDQMIELANSLKTLEKEDMERCLDMIVGALQADLIDADDFRLPRTA